MWNALDNNKNLVHETVLPLATQDISVNSDSIVINESGYYLISGSCNIDSTCSSSTGGGVVMVINNSANMKLNLFVSAGHSQVIYDETVLELQQGDIIKFNCTGKDTGCTMKNLKLKISKLDY